MLWSDSVARRVLLADSALARPTFPLRIVRSEDISLEDRTAGRKVSSEVDAWLTRTGDVDLCTLACSEFLRRCLPEGLDDGVGSSR